MEGAHDRCQVGKQRFKHNYDDSRRQFGADGARSIHQSSAKVLIGYSAPACQQPCQRLLAALGASQSTPDAFYLSEESGCPAQSSAGGHLVVGPSFIGRSDTLIRVYRNRSKRSCFFAVGVGLRAGECGVSVCERVYPRDLHINPVTSIAYRVFVVWATVSNFAVSAPIFTCAPCALAHALLDRLRSTSCCVRRAKANMW